jgi:outer membrane protein assembly factor BamB
VKNMMERQTGDSQSSVRRHAAVLTSPGKTTLLGMAVVAAGLLTVPGDLSVGQQPLVQFPIFQKMRTGRDRTGPVEGVFLPADRETSLRLERAKEMLSKEQVADAVLELDRILDQREDFFFKPDPNQTVHRSLKAEAQRLIGALNNEQRAIYELQFGASARQLLDGATQGGDFQKLSEVVRRYFHTEAGYEAGLVLARHHMDHGEPLAAALVLSRIKSAPAAAEKYEPNLSLLAAASWLRAGVSEKAKEELAAIKRSFPNAKFELASKSFSINGDDADLAALAALVAGDRAARSELVTNWTMPGGNPARNAAMEGGSPLLNERWSAGLYYSRSLNQEMTRLRKQFIDSGRAAIGCAQPLAVGNLVLMRTPHVVYAVDFETGKLLWPWPPQQVSEEQVNAGRDPSYMQLISERTWENNTYGTMTSDGELMFMVHEGDIQDALRGGARTRSPRAVFMANGRMVQSPGAAPQNVLSAHSLRREGALEWYLGGLESEMEPQLAGAFFMGPPLPLLGRLYVLAEMKGGINLVVLDAKTGKLEWMQQLAMVELNVQQDPYRRMSGVTPSFADGVLVCPTAAGAAVAVDLATRSLLWGYQYPRTPDQERMMQQRMAMGWNFNGMAAPVQPGTHWVDSAAVIAGGRVFLTPVESDQLHCLSLMDGKPLWSKRREGGLYIAAATSDQVIVVGEQQVEVFGAADKKALRTVPLGSNRPSGRGFLSGSFYYLPLSSAEVIKIDVTTGEVKARARSRSGAIPGNLICYNGYVISQGVDSLDKYFQIEPLRKRVDAMLAEKPNDPEALAWRGEIALDDGDLKRAVSDLRKSYEFRPPNNAEADYLSRLEAERLRTRGLLIDALTASLNENFAGNKESLAQLESLIETEQERALYLRVLAAGLQSEGKTALALANYLKLADLKAHGDELEDVEPSRSVRRERWIGAQLDELWNATKPDDRAAIDQAIAARLDAIEKPTDATGAAQEVHTRADRLRDFVATFAFHPLAEKGREQLVLQLSETESPLEREQLLAHLARSPDKSRAGAAVARLASLYQSADRPREAAMFYRKLAGEYAEVVCVDGKTGKDLAAALVADSKVRQAMRTDNPWPAGVVRDNKRTVAGGRNQGYQYWNVELRGDLGSFFEGQSVQFDQSMSQLIGRDELGAELFRVVLNEAGQFRNFGFGYNTNSAVVDGHLLLVNTGFQVLAINTLRSDSRSRRVLWHEDLADAAQLQMQQMMGLGGVNARAAVRNPWGPTRNATASIGNQPPPTISPVIDGGVAVLRGRELSFLDALSGKPLWVRHNVPAGSDIYGDSEILIVASPDTSRSRQATGAETEALVLRTHDGKWLGTRTAPRVDLRWATFGRNMLTWDPRGRSMRLLLRDVWGEKEVDLGSYTRGSKGTVVGGDSVAIYDAAGKFVVRSLADGRKLFEAAVEPDDQLRSIFVQRSENQYILISNRPRMARPSSRQENYQPAVVDASQQDGFNNGLVCGRVYAFDRETGKSQWERPAIIDMHGYVASQGSELPVLVFVRHTYSNNGQMKVSILCLDKRTGRAVYQNDAIPGQASGFEAVADPEARTVALQFPGNSIELAFTDEPVKDVAPYQAGAETPRDSGYSGSNMEKLFKVLGEAAGRLNDGAGGAKEQDQKKAAEKTKTKEVAPKEAEKPR